MEFAVGALLAGRDRCMGGSHRRRAENRKFLHHPADLRVLLQQLHDRINHPLAVTALVIEKFDHSDIAVRVTDHRVVFVTGELFLHMREGGALAFLFR